MAHEETHTHESHAHDGHAYVADPEKKAADYKLIFNVAIALGV